MIMKQVHGTDIIRFSSEKDFPAEPGAISSVDAAAFIRHFNKFSVGIRIADCMPVFVIWDKRMIGACHAGWRGINGEIVPKLLEISEFKAIKKSEITVLTGPHICGNCFEVAENMKSKFPATAVNGRFVDLFESLRYQLIKTGIPEENIIKLKKHNYCTYENDKYYSHRKGDGQRMLAFAIQH